MKRRRRINISFHYELWRQFRPQVDDGTWLSMDHILANDKYGNVFEPEELIYAGIRLYYET